MKNAFLTIGLIVGCGVFAATDELPDVFNASTGYVTQKAKDGVSASYKFSSFFTNDTTLVSVGGWNESALAPHADANYYSGKTLCTPNQTTPSRFEFAGDTLVMGDGSILQSMTPNASQTVGIPQLYLLGGAQLNWYGVKAPLDGLAHVRRSNSSKAVRFYSNTSIAQSFDMDVDGDAEQVVWVYTTGDKKSTTFNLRGDWSAYCGSLWIEGLNGGRTTMVMSNGVMNARVRVAADCELKTYAGTSLSLPSLESQTTRAFAVAAGTTWTIGDLTVSVPTTFELEDGNSRLIITNTVVNTSGEPIRIVLKGGINATSGEAQLLSGLIQLPEAVETNQFSFTVGTTLSANGLPKMTAAWALEGDRRTLSLNIRPWVEYVLKNHSDSSQTPLESATWTNGASYWSDDQTPHSGVDYYVSTDRTFYLPAADGVTTFAGDSLTCSGVFLQRPYVTAKIFPSGVDFKNLYVVGTSRTMIRFYGSASSGDPDGFGFYTVRGAVDVAAGATLEISPYQPKSLIRHEGELTGAGSVKISSYRGANAETTNEGSGELCGTNVNFTGQVLIDHDYYTKKNGDGSTLYVIPNFRVHTYIVATDGRNLGGPLDAFRYNSLWLRHYGCLFPRRSLTLDQTNRGVYLSDKALVELKSGVELSILNPVTLDGELIAYGRGAFGGTLALGGPLRFAANNDLSDVTGPTAEKNIMTISNICLKALSTNAFNGAAITLKDQAKLLVDLGTTDEAVRSNGLYNVAGSLAADADGKIRVAFENVPENGGEAAICTVAAASPLAVESFTFERPAQMTPTVFVREANGAKTFVVTLARGGMLVIFR